jgi:Omp85 superfamily domain
LASEAVRGAALIFLLCSAIAGPARAAQVDKSAEVKKPTVRVDVPEQQSLPNSSVLPAGVETSSAGYPGPSSTPPANSSTASRRGEFVIAPIPFSNEAFSFGIVPVVDYVFHIDPNDKTSPPSSLLVAGMLATGDSWAIGGGTSLYFKQDRFRFTGFGGQGSVGYDIFGVGIEDGDKGEAVPIRQGGNLALVEFLVRLKGKFFVGPRFNYRNLSAHLRSSTDAVPQEGLNPEDLGSDFKTHAPGLKILHDTRSDVFYPTSGHTLQIVADFFDATKTSARLGEQDVRYQNYQLSYDHYLSLTPSQVLAFRGMICAVDGDPPFYELCLFGLRADIRGYEPGRYRDRLMFATQGEYRKTLGRHFGFVLFGGVGEVAETWDSFNTENLLPAGGTGIRFNVSSKRRINLRADMAYGKNGWSWNFSVGEAF